VVVECISLPVFVIFYNVRLQRLGLLFLVMLLGTWGITVIGTLFSAMTVNLRLRELMLPTLIYPMLIPALVGAIELSRVFINGGSLAENFIWFRILVAFNVIFTVLSLALVDIVLVG
jgi:heme exporter protein B